MKYKEDIDSNLGNHLYEIRRKAGKSQEDVADILGVSRQTVSKWERGESSPRAYRIEKLCRELNISPDEIYSGENNNKATKEGSTKYNVKAIKKKIINRIIKIILGAFIVFYICNFIFKFAVLTYFTNKLKMYENVDNYYCKITKFGEEGLDEQSEIWYKDGYCKIKIKARNNRDYDESIQYYDFEKMVRISYNNRKEVFVGKLEKSEKQSIFRIFPQVFSLKGKDKIMLLISLNVFKIQWNDNIIHLFYKNEHIQLDNKSFLPVQYSTKYESIDNIMYDLMTYYKFEIGNVTDEDVELDKIKDASKEASNET